MGSFAADRTLCDADLTLIAEAQRGEPGALRKVCERFQTPILAMALRATGSLPTATGALESVLHGLLEQLLLGHMVAVEWPERAATACSTIPPNGDSPSDTGQGIGGMQMIPRVARRRIVRDVLPQLPLPELTALLMKYLDRRTPADMVGIVADTPREAQQRLVAAHELLQRALDEQLASQEASR